MIRRGSLGSDAVRMWVGHLVRTGWRATVLLALFAGLAGGVAMGAWSAGRRTATSFDRFVAFADVPDLLVMFCPPGLEDVTDRTLDQCFSYEAADEVAILNDLPEVDIAAFGSLRGLTAERPGEPAARTLANHTRIVGTDAELSFLGRQLLVEGRMPAPGAADEVAVNEHFASQSGVRVGERLQLSFWAADEAGTLPQPGENFSGPRVRVRVVGVVRGLRDLAAASTSPSTVVDESQILGTPAFGAATADAGGFGGVLVQAADDDADAAIAAIRRSFPDQQISITPAVGDEELDPIRESIRYEAGAALAFGALAALATAVFVGQAVTRQCRREWREIETLRALGMSERDVRASAVARGLLVGVLAAFVAVVTSVALSPLGPIGLGRRAEIDRGVSVDGVVLAVGAFAVLAVVTFAAWLPVRNRRSWSAASRAQGRARFSVRTPLPAPVSAGLSMTTRGGADRRGVPIGTALIGLALAVATVAAAAGLSSSLDALTGSPERFGAPWDVSLAAFGEDPENAAEFQEELLRDQTDIAAAAAIVGTDVEVDDEVIWVQAFQPIGDIDGIRPVITDGREPVGTREIALGSLTMERLDVAVGDTVDVASTVTGGASGTMTVVGATVINDTYEESPGSGGVVSPEWIAAYAPETGADPYVLRLESGTDVDAFLAGTDARLAEFASPPILQDAIGNVERIAGLPYLLAGLVAVLAAGSLAHALVLSIRRSRHQLAIWKSIGFTRRQVCAAVACHATTLALGAIVVGVPLGVITGRLGWQSIAATMGVASGPVTSLVGIVAGVLGVLLLANLIAAYPAWRASRLSTAEALRVE